MTKQEYDSSKCIIRADKKLGQTNRSKELLYLADEYIKSLEAENQRLNRINANSVSKMELDTCRSLNDALREDNVRLRKDNQSLVEQIHIMAEFLVAEGICPFTPCIHKQSHTDEDCMFCWEHRGNGTKGDKP
jgi:hypothetical protein